MTKTMKTLVVMASLALAGASTVSAQVQPPAATRGFVNVDVGAQPARSTISISGSFPKHDETATFSADGGVKNGAFFGVSGGVKAWRSLYVAIGYTGFSSKSGSTVTASIPHPLFFNQPKTSTQSVADLERTEHGVHLMAVWLMPVTDKIDVAFSAGPSFISVSQQLVGSVTVPDGTQNFTPNVTSESGTVKGGNIGVDGTYLITRNVGVGLLLRYAGGKVDLPSIAGVHAGGFQAGIGARVRF